MRRAGLSLLIALGILFACYLVFLRVEVGQWLLAPEVYPAGQWSVGSLYHAQNVVIPESAQVRLAGWWIAGYSPQRTVLLLHGRRGNITRENEQILRLRHLGSNLLLVDYRGYGRSTGQASLAGMFQDGEAAYQYLRRTRKIPAAKIVIQGDGLGSAVAMHLAARHPHVGGLVLESPFPSLRAWANSFMPLAGWMLPAHPSIAGDIQRYPGPKLILYGDNDRNTPAAMAAAVYQSAAQPKWQHIVAGGAQAHLTIDAGNDYDRWMSHFYLAAKLAPQPPTIAPGLQVLTIARH